MINPPFIEIGNARISSDSPSFFIADIAANHDGDINRAIDLIWLAADSGANAAKFQHFNAKTIVSDIGFRSLGDQQSHQKSWKKSVYQVYEEASLDTSWTAILKKECDKANITFMTSPYSFELVDLVFDYVEAFKIGSGDITWIDLINYIAKKNKPYILATGASSLEDVSRAVNSCYKINKNFALMQCNTNYTGSIENMRYIQLNVLKKYKEIFPDILLGLSDHTPGHSTVLGAITLGARVIEKHFTDDVNRDGPDHSFSMDPNTWKSMIYASRELEAALGGYDKKIEDNETQTVILQRRSIRVNLDLPEGSIIKPEDISCLRPCPNDALPPYKLNEIIGKKLNKKKLMGDYISINDIDY